MSVFVITLFCLLISFFINNKKMKLVSILQAVLSFVVSFIVFLFLPNALFEHLARDILGNCSYIILQNVLLSLNSINISIFDVIIYALILLTFLSVLNILEIVKELSLKPRHSYKALFQNAFLVFASLSYLMNKIYLLYCRLIS